MKLRALAALMVPVQLMAAIVATQPAAAWPSSSTVTLQGKVSLCGAGPIQTATIKGRLDDEYHDIKTPAGAPPSYSFTFNYVKSSGGWAWFVVTCTVANGPKGYWVRVDRPTVGSTISYNFT
jgi:hypothetical protein